MGLQEVMTVQEVADALKVSKRVVRGLIKKDRLRANKVGKELRLLESDVAAYIAALGKEPK